MSKSSVERVMGWVVITRGGKHVVPITTEKS